jgi:uncharacterized protein YukE
MKEEIYMDRNISVEDPNKLAADGEEIVNTANNFKAEIDAIYNTVDELKKTWTGGSAKRYTDDIEKFKEDLYNFEKIINGHGQLVNSVGKDYIKLEDEL